MSNNNKLVQNMVIGAAAGALLSLLHKPTRQSLTSEGKVLWSRVQEYVHEPSLLTDDVKAVTERTRDLVQRLTTDVQYVNEKVHQLKETTPAVLETLKETKDVMFASTLEETREAKKGM